MSESSAIDLVFASLGDPESPTETTESTIQEGANGAEQVVASCEEYSSATAESPIEKDVSSEQQMPSHCENHPDEHTARNEDALVACDELHSLIESLRSGAVKKQFQRILDRLTGASFGTYETNAVVVESVNLVGAALGVTFRISDGQAVRLRCVNPPRSKEGSFQLRTADRSQKTLYSGVKIPLLQITD